eukprot:symbB.v1.2.027073.t4/scaffold2751.1/size71576/2
MKVSSGRSKRTPGQSCRPSLTEWVFCMFFSVTLACVAAVLSFRSLLHIQEEKYRPGFLEASTSITEAPTEPPVEAVLVFDSAMPGMLPKAVWHSKASQAVVPPLPPNTAGIEGLVQRTQVTTSAPNCEVLLPDLANRLAKDLHSAQEQRNLDLAVQAWKGLLSGKIQVDYMRQRLCSRMEAWFKSLTTMSWQSPRGVTSVLVWPQAAYLHFGVKRVWSLGEYTQLAAQIITWPTRIVAMPWRLQVRRFCFLSFCWILLSLSIELSWNFLHWRTDASGQRKLLVGKARSFGRYAAEKEGATATPGNAVGDGEVPNQFGACGCSECWRSSLLRGVGGAAAGLGLLWAAGPEKLSKGLLVKEMAGMADYERLVRERKAKTFQKALTNVERLVEVGVGGGVNFPYFKKAGVKEVIAVEPNLNFLETASAAADQSQIQLQVQQGAMEKMPFSDNSVDVVVGTLLLCSVQDLKQSIKEEHVAAAEGEWLRSAQDLCDPLQQVFAAGCHLTRQPLPLIRQTFQTVNAECWSLFDDEFTGIDFGWADLCAALATLGLQVKLWPFQKKSFPTPSIYESVNAVYTDYNGVHAGKGVGARPPPDKTWLLDTFGTDGTVVANDFFGRIPPLTDYPLHRFLTLVPGYSSRNTFLGVAAVAGSTEASTLPERRWQCVLWSKVHPWLTESNGFPAYHWKLLREYTKYCKVIATVDIKDTYKTAELIRTCCPAVEIREVQSPKAFQELIRGSAVYMASDEREKEAEDDVQQIISELTDNQKHELVGRILQEQDTEQWGAVFESAALQRFRERSIRFVEMSGRENELKLDPFERLGSIQQLLADQMDTNPREGMHRVVKCFHGSNRLGEDTIVAMLPEEVNIVITEEPDPDTETSSEYTDHGFSASNSYTDYSELSFD